MIGEQVGRRVLTGRRVSKTSEAAFVLFYIDSMCGTQFCQPRAESAKAFTGRRNSHSGRGEDFLTGQSDFFYGNSSNSGTESRKIVPKLGN